MSLINIEKWDVEDNSFWESMGKKIAFRNLWISIPALLQSFSIWIIWGMIIVQMKKLGFTLGLPHQSPEDLKIFNELLFTLSSIILFLHVKLYFLDLAAVILRRQCQIFLFSSQSA